MGDIEYTVEKLYNEKAVNLHNKLYECLKKAMKKEEELGCHINTIVVKLAKSIESKETWYDESTDLWCDYFLRTPKRREEKLNGK